MLSIVMLSVVMLSVVMLSVMAPSKYLWRILTRIKVGLVFNLINLDTLCWYFSRKIATKFGSKLN
jgi:hypothetical protein